MTAIDVRDWLQSKGLRATHIEVTAAGDVRIEFARAAMEYITVVHQYARYNKELAGRVYGYSLCQDGSGAITYLAHGRAS